ncbi:hypothetical protein [Endozoicomonas arenosclerae]|uniref:hypothetical protein n=1 Tax=Endozoicomonas arenosclerae TaxID=1633495 RepID=UPI000780A099|nr:hypothetical protein [Endozoicomonas arenosclerae]
MLLASQAVACRLVIILALTLGMTVFFAKVCLAIQSNQGELSSEQYKVMDEFNILSFEFSFDENGALVLVVPQNNLQVDNGALPVEEAPSPILIQGILSTNLLVSVESIPLSGSERFFLLPTDLYLAVIVAAFVMANDSATSTDLERAFASHTLSTSVEIGSFSKGRRTINALTYTLLSSAQTSERITITLSEWDQKTIRVAIRIGEMVLTYYIKRPEDDLKRLLALLPDQEKPESRKHDDDDDPDPDTVVDSGCGSCFWSLCCWCCNWGSSSESKPINQGSIQYGSNQQQAVRLIFELDLMPSIVLSDLFKTIINETVRLDVSNSRPLKSMEAIQHNIPEGVSAW